MRHKDNKTRCWARRGRSVTSGFKSGAPLKHSHHMPVRAVEKQQSSARQKMPCLQPWYNVLGRHMLQIHYAVRVPRRGTQRVGKQSTQVVPATPGAKNAACQNHRGSTPRPCGWYVCTEQRDNQAPFTTSPDRFKNTVQYAYTTHRSGSVFYFTTLPSRGTQNGGILIPGAGREDCPPGKD